MSNALAGSVIDAKPLRLNIGAGDFPFPGESWINLDRKFGDEAYPIKIADRKGLPLCKVVQRDEDLRWHPDDNTFTEIYASHILEHFSNNDAQLALRHWVAKLKPGGRLRIAVPDFDKIIDAVNKGNPNGWKIQGYIYGGQTDENDYHKSGYSYEWLKHLMELSGLVNIQPWTGEIGDCASEAISLNLEGFKSDNPTPITKPFPSHIRFSAVMSLPRLAFTQTMFCVTQALMPYQIPLQRYTGAFWDQCLARVMEDIVRDNSADVILAIDYDSVFSPKDVHQLAVLMNEHPEADAIAPIQQCRQEQRLLMRPIDEKGEYCTGPMAVDRQQDLVRVGWANFGLTMIRVSSLKKAKKPWFLGKPAPDGGWGDGRTDSDIYFWNNWRDSGLSIYSAINISIGHQQEMTSWPTPDGGVVHQYTADYLKNGKPKEAI